MSITSEEADKLLREAIRSLKIFDESKKKEIKEREAAIAKHYEDLDNLIKACADEGKHKHSLLLVLEMVCKILLIQKLQIDSLEFKVSVLQNRRF